MLTSSHLKEILRSDPDTGLFTWLVDRGSNKILGTIAGSDNGQGYILISINGKNYKAHRLAWLYMTGEWPVGLIDHKDLNRSNNIFQNLRVASNSENKANSLMYANNRSGAKGVFFAPDRKRQWRAKIRKNGHLYCLGSFSSKKEAEDAYLIASVEYFGEFSRTGGGQ